MTTIPLPPGSSEDVMADEARQAQLLADAIQDALTNTGLALRSAGVAPQLNAVFGALASHVAEALCSIEKPAHRRMMRDAFNRSVSKYMRIHEADERPMAQTFVHRPKSQMS
jgi:hypothetical protein